MTEAEWQRCAYPEPMLKFLKGKASDRKLRLFAVDCCRRVRNWISCKEGQMAAAAGERYADGGATLAELEDARVALSSALPPHLSNSQAAVHATRVALDTVETNAFEAAVFAARGAFLVPACAAEEEGRARGEEELPAKVSRSLMRGEVRQQATVLRDIFGNPFHPLPPIDPAWLAWGSGTVRKLAQGIYDERAFDDLPILADALEEAGCDQADLLGHLRGPGPHVRGCWAVDAVLGKE